MLNSQNIFFNKKILIYGLGKSGLSTFKFLRKNNRVIKYDDKIKTNYKEIKKIRFDYIILSPGIDINKCILSSFLKKNYKKIWGTVLPPSPPTTGPKPEVNPYSPAPIRFYVSI